MMWADAPAATTRVADVLPGQALSPGVPSAALSLAHSKALTSDAAPADLRPHNTEPAGLEKSEYCERARVLGEFRKSFQYPADQGDHEPVRDGSFGPSAWLVRESIVTITAFQ